MSRTKKGSKGLGYEYEGRRPGGRVPGKSTKKRTHKLERKSAAEILHEAGIPNMLAGRRLNLRLPDEEHLADC